MKKKLFTLMVAVWVSCTLCATSIDRQQATQLARDFMAKNFKSSAARRAAQTIPLTSKESSNMENIIEIIGAPPLYDYP